MSTPVDMQAASQMDSCSGDFANLQMPAGTHVGKQILDIVPDIWRGYMCDQAWKDCSCIACRLPFEQGDFSTQLTSQNAVAVYRAVFIDSPVVFCVTRWF